MTTTKLRTLFLTTALVGAACGGDDGAPEENLACFDETNFFHDVSLANTFGVDPELEDPTNLTAPNFAPQAGSPVLSAGATPPASLDTSATFAGAIGAVDWTAGWTAYPADTGTSGAGSTVEVNADITTNTTWTADHTYVLKGHIFVRDAKLTIEAGTVIRGDSNSSLVITSTAKIEAEGTVADPIVFTSSKDTGAAPGDWGGVVLLGTAPINVAGGVDNIEGFAASTTGTEYGGTDTDHDCGSLEYVRIEYAGFELSADNELNGLTVGACGGDTKLDYIQIHRGADDGVEFFGGTAGISHLVVTQPDDDGLDWDFGWTGLAQFIVVQQSATSGNMGFESDSNKNDNEASPRSAPTIWNVTLVGSDAEPGTAAKLQAAMHLRRGTAGDMGNFVITHFADFAIDVDGTSSAAQAEAGALSVHDSYFFDNANDVEDGFPAGFDDGDAGENDCAAIQ